MSRDKMNARATLLTVMTTVLLTVLVAGTVARAEDPDGGWAGDWLINYQSARAVGLGGSFVGLADEPTGMAWNPAGMTQLSRNEVFLETSRYFEGTSINTLGFAVPGTRYPTLGLSILALRTDEFEKTNDVNDTMGSFDYGETAYLLSASHNVHRRVALGANLRIVHHSIDEFSATGAGLDLGVLVKAGETVRVGLSALNLGGPNLELRDTKESYPEVIRAGTAVDVLDGRGLVTAELQRIGDFRTSLRGGGEYFITRTIALRAGYDGYNPVGGFSVDLPRDLRLDYGAGNHDLGVIHRFSVSWRFGGFYAKSQASNEIISPLGSKSATRFDLAARTRHDIESWRLEISDHGGRIVRTFGGRGTPPGHLMWDGKTGGGIPLPDGSYDYRLVVTDLGGLVTNGESRSIGIDTKARTISVPVQVSGK
ncbi:MAG: hypothetical protein GY838_15655 [bacterium]|nr:hypothetical protein [bacterium]